LALPFLSAFSLVFVSWRTQSGFLFRLLLFSFLDCYLFTLQFCCSRCQAETCFVLSLFCHCLFVRPHVIPSRVIEKKLVLKMVVMLEIILLRICLLLLFCFSFVFNLICLLLLF
jgi:hypothetical protein